VKKLTPLLSVLLGLLISISVFADVKIKGPDKGENYEQLTFKIEGALPGSAFIWDVYKSGTREKVSSKSIISNKDTVTFVAPPGKYDIEAIVSSYDAKTSQAFLDRVNSSVTIVGEVKPTPTPPTPTPPTPTPSDNAPIPVAGLRVLIVHETMDTNLTKEQQVAIYGKTLRDYLRSKCVKVDDVPEARIWDKDVDTTNASKLWQDVMKRERKSLPWIVVSNGKTGFEGPLPKDTEEIMNLIKKFE